MRRDEPVLECQDCGEVIRDEPVLECQDCGEVIRRLSDAEAQHVAREPYLFVLFCPPCHRVRLRAWMTS